MKKIFIFNTLFLLSLINQENIHAHPNFNKSNDTPQACPFSSTQTNQKHLPSKKLAEENNPTQAVYTDHNEIDKRDYWLNISNNTALVCNAISSGLAASSFLNSITGNSGLALGCMTAAIATGLSGQIFKAGVNKTACDFNSINFPQETAENSWTDGTYPNVNRYPVQSHSITWEHATKAWFLRANYTLQFLKFIKYKVDFLFKEKQPTETDIIDYILNSTVLTLFSSSENDTEMVLTLNDNDFKSSFSQIGKLSTIEIEVRIPKSSDINKRNLIGAEVTKFKYDDYDITKYSEQLLILSTICAFTIHPLLHSFFNSLYNDYLNLSVEEKRTWSDLFLHGQFLNSIAHTYPADCVGIPQDVLSSIFAYNVRRNIKNHTSTVMMVKDYSRFANFLINIRGHIYSLVKKYNVPVNPETLFLTSVMHSLDHFTTGNALLFKNLDTERLPAQKYPHLENFMFYYPSENVLTNRLADKTDKHPFYMELYKIAKKLDPEYASHITLSISF